MRTSLSAAMITQHAPWPAGMRTPVRTSRAVAEDHGVNPRAVERWAVRAVPRVYGAARGAGLGRREAVRALEGSAHAIPLARRRYPRRCRAGNAVRHLVWQA